MKLFIWLAAALAVGRTAGTPPVSVHGASLATAAPAVRAPDELGSIPILEYHSIGGEPEFSDHVLYDIHGLNIAPATLERQLGRMYAAGWYPVNMRDLLTARLRVPRGRIPCVLTFDDARPSQFRYLPNGKIDSKCAVGILEAFHARHRDWPRRATFYVLPESKWNGVPFDQDGLEGRKLRFLARHGYEVANHTTSHRSLADMSAATLRWEMAGAVRDIRRLAPRAPMDTMALPYGIAPKKRELWRFLLDGRQGGTRYHNRCILLASGGPARPYAHRLFDREAVPRIEPRPGNIERWIEALRPGGPTPPYVSDGKAGVATIPQWELVNLNRRRLHGARLVVTPGHNASAQKDTKAQRGTARAR
jgi:hypothetical protein